MAFFDNEDLNGSCFIAGELGEVEELRAERVVWFEDAGPAATVFGAATAFTSAQAVVFLELNFGAVKAAEAARTDAEAAIIAYMRFLAARQGLVSPNFDPAANHVSYNEARFVAAIYPQAATTLMGAAPYARPNNHPAGSTIAPISGALTDPVKKRLRTDFANYTCCVAYMFRVRGHHWLEDMNAKYENLWTKCLKANQNPGISWQLVAHHALHAIMPQHLDTFWREAVANSNVAGALMKRFDSAPAGVAGVKALEAGMADLAVTVPGFKELNKDLYAEMSRLVEALRNSRWAGSINRRFYAAQDLGFAEGRFAGIASTIMAALDQFAPSSQLRNSKALQRMAAAAPISGGFTAKLIAAAANDPDNAKALVNAGHRAAAATTV
jgi:hypothetical protein